MEIRNVWADNLEREMVVIRELVERYPYVAMVSEVLYTAFSCFGFKSHFYEKKLGIVAYLFRSIPRTMSVTHVLFMPGDTRVQSITPQSSPALCSCKR